MHRKGRFRCFFKLIFPNEVSPFDADIDVFDQLDFRPWLTTLSVGSNI